jgi:uncharacterized protein YdeI (YjbR/CyaY-like superfamily)
MNAAFAVPPELHSEKLHAPQPARPPALAVPGELLALFEESAKMKTSFWRLEDQERRGFVRYIDEAKTPTIRERRAAIIAMSLMGLARDIKEDPRG